MSNDLVSNAVLYNLLVIDEAASHVPEEIQSRFPDVDSDTIRGMRNVVAHALYAVNLPVIWRTATENVPASRPALQAIEVQDLD